MRFLQSDQTTEPAGSANAADRDVSAVAPSLLDSPEQVPDDADDLRCIERLLAVLEKETPDPFQLPRRAKAREPEQTSGALLAWALQPLPGAPSSEARGGFLAYLFLGLGLMAFACGGVMLGWSLATQREDLWSLGIPLALGGQAAMLFGLVGLAEAATQRNKLVAAALDEHRQRLTMMQNLVLAGQTTPPRRAA